MAGLLTEGYVEDQSAQRKAAESPSSVNIVCNILSFLDASPMTLFQGPPENGSEQDLFYRENLESLVSCVVAADESVRRLATGVAKRLFARESVLAKLRSCKGIKSQEFRTDFWRLT
jgi:neurofibromin 1